jgi:hypothetical protein
MLFCHVTKNPVNSRTDGSSHRLLLISTNFLQVSDQVILPRQKAQKQNTAEPTSVELMASSSPAASVIDIPRFLGRLDKTIIK